MSLTPAVNAASNPLHDKDKALKKTGSNALSKRAASRATPPADALNAEEIHAKKAADDKALEKTAADKMDADKTEADTSAFGKENLLAVNPAPELPQAVTLAVLADNSPQTPGATETPKINWGTTLDTPSTMSSALGFNPLWLGAALALGAGGGGGGGGGAGGVSIAGVKVIDGPVVGAKVYVVFTGTSTEVEIGVTEAKGALKITTTDATVLSKLKTDGGTLIAKGGVNDNGLPNTVDMKMSFESGLTTSSVITPVTTLVTALVARGSTLAAANATIVSSLGLPTGTSLSHTDPTDTGVNAAVALSLMQAGTVLNNMASQVANKSGLFDQFATQLQTAIQLPSPQSFFDKAKNVDTLTTLLTANGGDATQAAGIQAANATLKDATSLAAVSAKQVAAAKPVLQLAHDTGTGAGASDGITTDKSLVIKGLNSANFGTAIQISKDGGTTWQLAKDFQLVSSQVVNDVSLLARQKDAPDTVSAPLAFTWINQSLTPVGAKLSVDTGVANDGITRDASVQLSQFSYQSITVGTGSQTTTFAPKVQYSLDAGTYQDLTIPSNGLVNFNVAQGQHALSIRTLYPELGLETTSSSLVFTYDNAVAVNPVFVLTPVGTPDVTDPNPSDYQLNTHGIDKVQINGQTEADAKVDFSLTGPSGASVVQHQIITADHSGHWQVQVDASLMQTSGDYTSSVTLTDVAGNTQTGALNHITVNNDAPVTDNLTAHLVHSTSSDSGIDPEDNITNGLTPAVEGQATAGFGVTVVVNDVTYTTTADGSGHWQVSLGALPPEVYTPTVTVTDLAGNVSDEFTGESFTVAELTDSDAPMMVAEDPTAVGYFIDFYDNADFNPTGVEEQYAALGQTIAWSTDTGVSAEDGITMFPFPKLSGTVDVVDGVDVTVLVKLDGKTYVTQVVDGEWSVQVTQALGADGETHTYTPKILLIDTAGNTLRETGPTLVIDREAPVFDDANPDLNSAQLVHDDTNDTGAFADDSITNATDLTLEGTSEPGAVVYVSFESNPDIFFISEPADDSGYWSVLVEGLTDGEYIPLITIIDAAGNVSGAIEGTMFTVDTLAPTEAFGALVHDEVNDTGLSQEDGLTNNTAPLIEGTAEAFAHISVDLNGTVFETDVAEDGTWSVTADRLTDGEYTPLITVTDLAGNASEPIEGETFTVDATAPMATDLTGGLVHDSENDTGLLADDGITNNPTPLIEGTAEAGALIHVDLNGTGLDTAADDTGYWSVTADGLDDGEYTPLITVVDAAGNTSEPFEGTPFTVDTQAPTEATANLVHDDTNDTGVDVEDSITQSTSVTVEGTTEAMALVSVDIGGTVYEDIQADEDGNWSVTVDGLEDGDYTPLITVTDAAGNASDAFEGTMFTVDTLAPTEATANLVHDEVNDTGLSQEDGLTNNTAPLIEGTAEAFAHISLDLNGTVFETDADEEGNWNITADGLEDGEYTPLITVTDLAGNASEPIEGETFTVDATAPMATDLTGGLVHDSENDTGLLADDGITNNPTPLIEGTAEAGALIHVDLNGTGLDTAADDTGYWSVTADGLDDGEYTPLITVVDAAGNTSEPFEGTPFTVDTQAPTEATANLVHDDTNDTGVDVEDSITQSTSVTVEGTTEAMALVSVDIGGTVYDTIADEDGNWNVTADALEDGDYTPLITVTDVAGNESEAIEGTPFTVDTTAPTEATANLVHDEVNDTGLSQDDDLTHNTAPLIEGTAEAGAHISVDLNGSVFETDADEEGLWRVTADGLDDGDYTPQITVTDAAGNTSEPIEGTPFTVDTSAPTEVTALLVQDSDNDTGSSSEDGITNNPSPTIQGTVTDAPLAHISVDLNGTVLETDADEDGNWSITADGLADGEYTPLITVTDLAGNVSDPIEGTPFTVDTVLPTQATAHVVHDAENDTGLYADDSVTKNPAPLLEGITEAFAIVSVMLTEDILYEEIVADENGYWSVQLDTLDDGLYTPLITVTDVAGNVSEPIEGEAFRVATVSTLTLPEISAPLLYTKGQAVNLSLFDAGHVLQDGEGWSDNSGSLPDGLVLANNVLSGTPTAAGSTWLEEIQADVAGNTSTTYHQLVVTASSKTPAASITINNTDATKAATYYGTSGDDANLNLYKSIGDVIFGMAGNDTFKLSSADSQKFAYIDGGAGLDDKLSFSLAGLALSLADFNNPDVNGQVVQHVENIYVSGVGASVAVTAKDIFNIHSDLKDTVKGYDTLKITGLTGREVSIDGLEPVGALNGFTDTGAVNNGTTNLFSKFQGAYTDDYGTDHWVTLLVQKGLTIV